NGAGAFENQRTRDSFTLLEPSFEPHEHQMVPTRLERYGGAGRQRDGLDLAHTQDVALLNMGVDFDLLGNRRGGRDQSVLRVAGVNETRIGSAGPRHTGRGARPG